MSPPRRPGRGGGGGGGMSEVSGSFTCVIEQSRCGILGFSPPKRFCRAGGGIAAGGVAAV